MAKLPTSLDAPQVHGTRPSPSATSAGDYGLGDAAKAMGDVVQGLQVRDQRTAQQAVIQARTNFDPSYEEAAKAYDGLTPGFAQGQVQAYDGHAASVRAGLDPNQQRIFDRLNAEQRLGVVDRASAAEAQASGVILHQQRQAEQDSRVISAATQHLVETQGGLDDAYRGGADPTAPDFTAGRLGDFDARAKARMEAAAPEDRPALEKQFANQRSDLALTLATASRNLRDARINQNVSDGLKALHNGVLAGSMPLDQAQTQAGVLLSSLPADQQTKLGPAIRSDIVGARVQGLIDREDWTGADALLNDKGVQKTLNDQAFAQARARVTQALTSQSRLLAQGTVARRLDAELASIRETGQPTGFDPQTIVQAFGPVEGPAKVAEAQRAIADAHTVNQITHDFAALTPKDQMARLALIKPAAGDPDFAHKQQVYEAAVATGQAQMKLRETDPAKAIQADKAVAAHWEATIDGAPATAQAWAADAVARQTALGIAPEQQRILPLDEAKRLVGLTQGKDAAGKADAYRQVFGYAQRFGDAYAGRVLYELQRAGLPTDAAALMNATDGDAVTVGRYTRAEERAATVKLQTGQKEAITAAVAHALKPLTDSYAATAGGQAYTDALGKAVATMATAGVGDGKSPQDAAAEAAAWVTGHFHIDAQGGWRMPPDLAARRDVPVLTATPYSGGPTLAPTTGELAVRAGARAALHDLVTTGTEALPGRGSEPWLTEGQKRQRYADQIASTGRWVNNDDGGLVLTVPDPRGGRAPVLDKAGKPVALTWDQLIARAGTR